MCVTYHPNGGQRCGQINDGGNQAELACLGRRGCLRPSGWGRVVGNMELD